MDEETRFKPKTSFDVKKRQIELVRDRGYFISEEESMLLTPDYPEAEFDARYQRIQVENKLPDFRQTLSSRYRHKVTGSILYVLYSGDVGRSVKIDFIKENVVTPFWEKSTSFSELLIVLPNGTGFGPTSEDMLKKLPGLKFRVYTEQQLLVDPLRSIYNPVFTLVDRDKRAATLKRLMSSKGSRRNIEVFDPAMRWRGYELGDLVATRQTNPFLNQATDIEVDVLSVIAVRRTK